MRHRRGSYALVAALVAVAIAAPLPAAAAPGAQTTMRRAISVEQARSMRPQAIRAAIDGEEQAPEAITGQVTPVGGYWEDALVAVAALTYYAPEGAWYESGWGTVNPDGTYRVDVWEGPGTYKVGFYDYAQVYSEVYYLDAATPDAGLDVAVAANETVTGIDQTLTAKPEIMITGKVAFEGGPAPAEPIEVGAFQPFSDPEYGEYWDSLSFASTKADGTYRLHLPATGTYRVGFYDYTGAFAEVYYNDADTLETATDIDVTTVGEPVESIDQTMTVLPSKILSGENRYATAVKVSQEMFPEDADSTVVIATGEDWPDALVGAPLAGFGWGPLLLTKSASLPAETLNEIRRLKPYEIIILGSYDAVSLATEISLRTYTDVAIVRRVLGRDRYETAALVAEETIRRMGEAPEQAIVVSGEAYADAMSAGPLATWNMLPILLTRHDVLPAVTADVLRKHKIGKTVVVGGTSAVGPTASAALPGMKRVSGANRYATAVALAEYAADEYAMSDSMFGLASGEDFPDGLVAGPFLGMQGRTLLLTRAFEAPAETTSFLADREVGGLTVFGGPAAIAPPALSELFDAAGMDSPYDTEIPDLP